MSGEQRTEHIENTNKILKLAPLSLERDRGRGFFIFQKLHFIMKKIYHLFF